MNNEKHEDVVVKVAFYKGEENILHTIIRKWTKSVYSHAELIMPDGYTWVSISPFLTSRVSMRARHKIKNPEDWDFLTLKLSWRKPVRDYQIKQLYKFIEETLNSKYDWCGMILSQLCPYLIKRRDRWYCSEWIAHALVVSRIIMWDQMKIYETPNMSPGKLYETLKKSNHVYQ